MPRAIKSPGVYGFGLRKEAKMDKFIIGLILGAILGALIVTFAAPMWAVVVAAFAGMIS
jgi:hypothetical protein